MIYIYVIPDFSENEVFLITLPPAVERLHYKFIIHPTFQGIICTTNTVGNDVIYGPISYPDFSRNRTDIQYTNNKQV